MKKKTYKQMINRIYRAQKAWLIEKEKRVEAEDKIADAEDKADRYQRRFRALGENVETIEERTGIIKMLKWTIPSESWGTYIKFDNELIRTEDGKRIEEYLKKTLSEKIAEGLIENDLIKFIIRDQDPIDPLNRYGTFGGKLYVVPWEMMPTNKTIQIIKRLKTSMESGE